jgi:NAD(P)-dependent dehydrogenase (short-subunit alcohol dehydrogenase family)
VHVLILGAAGMIGRKLTARLVADGNVGGRRIERLTLADLALAGPPPARRGRSRWSLRTWPLQVMRSVWWRVGRI